MVEDKRFVVTPGKFRMTTRLCINESLYRNSRAESFVTFVQPIIKPLIGRRLFHLVQKDENLARGSFALEELFPPLKLIGRIKVHN